MVGPPGVGRRGERLRLRAFAMLTRRPLRSPDEGPPARGLCMVLAYMGQPRLCDVGFLLFASLIVACSTSVQPSAVDWSERLPVTSPFGEQPKATNRSLLGLLRFKTNESEGYLRVYTDTDVRVNGGLDSNVGGRSTSMRPTVR